VELTGHYNIDFAPFLESVGVGATDEEINDHLRDRLISEITSVTIPHDRITVLSHIVDSDQKGVDLDLSVLPSIDGEEGTPTTAEIAQAVHSFLLITPGGGGGDAVGDAGGAPGVDVGAPGAVDVGASGGVGTGDGAPQPVSSHVFPFSAFNGAAPEAVAVTPMASNTSSGSSVVPGGVFILMISLIAFVF